MSDIRAAPLPNVGRVLSYMAAAVFLWWACDASAALGVTGPVGSAGQYVLRSALLGGYLWVAWRLERGNFRTSSP